MGAIQSRARSAFNKLSFFLGDGTANAKAAGDHLQEHFGTRDPLALNDSQAKQFAESVRNKYGAFRARGMSPSDHDHQPLIPSTDGSRKAKLDPQAIWKRFNSIGLNNRPKIQNVADDE